jgi:hypothetical protein
MERQSWLYDNQLVSKLPAVMLPVEVLLSEGVFGLLVKQGRWWTVSASQKREEKVDNRVTKTDSTLFRWSEEMVRRDGQLRKCYGVRRIRELVSRSLVQGSNSVWPFVMHATQSTCTSTLPICSDWPFWRSCSWCKQGRGCETELHKSSLHQILTSFVFYELLCAAILCTYNRRHDSTNAVFLLIGRAIESNSIAIINQAWIERKDWAIATWNGFGRSGRSVVYCGPAIPGTLCICSVQICCIWSKSPLRDRYVWVSRQNHVYIFPFPHAIRSSPFARAVMLLPSNRR